MAFHLASFYIYLFRIKCSSFVSHTIVGDLQAGAPFGTCKNIAVPSASPITNNSGSFTGSIQFTRSASPPHSPNHKLLLFFFPLIAVLLLL